MIFITYISSKCSVFRNLIDLHYCYYSCFRLQEFSSELNSQVLAHVCGRYCHLSFVHYCSYVVGINLGTSLFFFFFFLNYCVCIKKWRLIFFPTLVLFDSSELYISFQTTFMIYKICLNYTACNYIQI